MLQVRIFRYIGFLPLANEVCGQGNVFTAVRLSTGGGLASHHASQVILPGGSASRGGLPLGRDLPPGGVCTWGESVSGGWADPPQPKIHGVLRDTVNKRAVRILLEYFLVLQYIII